METDMRVFTARFLLPPVPSPAVQFGDGGGDGRSRLLWSAFWVYFPLIAAACVVNLIWWFMEIDQAGGVWACWGLFTRPIWTGLQPNKASKATLI